jgi:hypothetical protein
MSDLVLTSPEPASGAADGPVAAAAAAVWQWRRRGDAEPAPRDAAAAARRKGAVGGTIGLLVAAGLFFWKPEMAAVVAAIAVTTTLLALVSPLGGFRRLSLLLEAFGRGVGLAMTWVVMTIAYALLFLPVGLLLRAAGKLRITRGADPRRDSYWEPPMAAPPGLDGYRKPF